MSRKFLAYVCHRERERSDLNILAIMRLLRRYAPRNDRTFECYFRDTTLAYELKLQEIIFKRQEELDIYYKDMLIPRKYTPDFVIEDKVIIEIKASSGLTANDEAQLLNYLKATGLRVGLLLNFGQESLEIKRRIL